MLILNPFFLIWILIPATKLTSGVELDSMVSPMEDNKTYLKISSCLFISVNDKSKLAPPFSKTLSSQTGFIPLIFQSIFLFICKKRFFLIGKNLPALKK